MSLFKKSFVGLAAITALAGSSFAVPYASNIRVGTTSVNAGTGTDINYILVESADSVTIEIVDSITLTPVATFAGTTTQGSNTVAWDGTVDNGAGLAVPVGSYRVKITADKANVGGTEITGQASTPRYAPGGTEYAQVFNGWSMNDVLFVKDTDSDFFGTVLANNSYAGGSSPAAAVVVLNSDLSTADGTDGYASRILREPTLDSSPASIANSSIWGGCLDPANSNIVFYTGQTSPSFWTGDLTSPASLTNADPSGFLAGALPRSVVVTMEGADKYAYFAVGNEIRKGPLNPATNELSAAPVVITSFTATRYARGVKVDAAGNLYFVSRQVSAGANGILLRWDAATVVGPAPALTEVNASWTITPDTGMLNMTGPAISNADGNVYVGFSIKDTVNSADGAYLVGNTATPTITKTLSASDQFVNATSIGIPAENWNIEHIYFNLRCDPAGNLLLMDRKREQMRMFTPGGSSSREILAPTSQTMTILPSSVNDWSVY